jgi:hypothetical protein
MEIRKIEIRIKERITSEKRRNKERVRKIK